MQLVTADPEDVIAPGEKITTPTINADNVTVEKVTLDIELCATLFAANEDNRNLSIPRVIMFARQFLQDRWKFNGATICQDRNGRFADGQHRLAAFWLANQVLKHHNMDTFTIPIILVQGLEPEARSTMDRTRRRSLADELSMAYKVKNAGTVAACIRLFWAYQEHDGDLRVARTDNLHTPSDDELIDLWRTMADDLPRHIHTAARLRQRLGLPYTPGILVSKILTDINEDEANYFFNTLVTGENIQEGNAIYALRRLLENKRKEKHIDAWLWVAWMFVGWNKWQAGAITGQIKFTAGGANPDVYPAPVDVLRPAS